MVFQHPFERRCPGDVPHQADCRGVEIGRYFHLLFLTGVDDRGNRQVIVQRLAAGSVDIPDRGPDLAIAVAVDVLLQEIDQAAVTLKHG